MIHLPARRLMLAVMLVGMLVFGYGCLPVPTEVRSPEADISAPGVFVLCEGLWRQDNSTLAFVGDDGAVVTDVVGTFNPGLRLGDTGTDLHVRGDSMWVVVSTSRSIELFHRRTGRWLARLRFDDLREPYKMAFVNDSVAVCTFLNDNSIAEFNARTMSWRVARIDVGPAPEGIAVMNGLIYVANSGLGDLRSGEPLAGTVLVLSAVDLLPVDTIVGLINAMSVVPDPSTSTLWMTYRHLSSTPDSLGGVVRYDPRTKAITEHHRLRSPKGLVVDDRTGSAWLLHATGVDRLAGGERTLIMPRASSQNWYALGFDARTGLLIIADARSYVTPGQVIIADTMGAVLRSHTVGINPGRIVVGN
ncbi:MAG: hypothetical protein FGM33_09005 [Candidatus Kapabacteria bacterium]|nr:hypothetical protein [Candidatus Kapabacteria bacterium]